jgi:FkbM family methyltransferase
MINGFENIYIYEGVAFDKEGEIQFELLKDSAYAYIIAEASLQEAVRISVKSTSLDTFVKECGISEIAVIKIDVEGAEYKVLLGARDILGADRIKPKLVMVELCSEYLARFDSKVEDVIHFMKDYGYLPHVIDSRGVLSDYTSEKVDEFFNVFFVRQ